MVSLENDWEEVVERKRAARQALLPAEWLIAEDELPSDQVLDVTSLCAERGWLSEEELGITTKTIVRLSEEIKTGQLSSGKVVSAFAHRATISQQLTNSSVFSRPFRPP
jgi:amidase